MKNLELFALADQLGKSIERLKLLKGAKFTFTLLKNIDLIDKEIKSLSECSKPTDEYNAYDKARVELCEKFCAKEENGELKKKPNPQNPNQFEYDIDTTSKEWTDAIETLRLTNVAVLEAREEQLNSYNELLQSDSDVTFSTIKLADVPNEISMDLMRVIKEFITE